MHEVTNEYKFLFVIVIVGFKCMKNTKRMPKGTLMKTLSIDMNPMDLPKNLVKDKTARRKRNW
jgi:hypothetical protein